jgi:Reverse transcriptase (RNA-dependent DNA polymerase)
MSLKRPFYKGRPIGSISALARALGVPETTLASVTLTASTLYRGPIIVRKAGRKPRQTYDALPALKNLHRRILDRILRHVVLPDYLLGGIKGCSYISNAARHSGSKILLGEDIDSFYPSISERRLQLIFQEVLQFPPLVSAVLARLCTREGVLVQGGVASTDLANLALYRTEPQLEEAARKRGLRYSRFIDDIHVSSVRARPEGDVQAFMAVMRRTLEREGFRPKRSKQFVAVAGKPMRVHGLNVNSMPSVPPAARQRLRNEVFLLERWAAMQPWDKPLEQCFLRLSSRVGHLKQTNLGDARRLQLRLKQLVPLRELYLLANPPEISRRVQQHARTTH